MQQADEWMVVEVGRGLQKLMCLSLPGTPAHDLIAGTVLAWVDALGYGRVWDQERDAPRIRDGFRALCALSIEWPNPHRLLDAMPAAKPQGRIAAPTDVPAWGDTSPEAQEARRRRLAALVAEANAATNAEARRRA